MNKNRIINVSIDRAREWYNGSDEALRKLALECYSVDELELMPFEKIKCFEDAVIALNLNMDCVITMIEELESVSKASAAMFKLNLVRRALNLGYDLSVTKNPKNSHIYYPFNQLVTKNSTYYVNVLYSNRIDIIGKIKCEGREYYVIGGEILGGNNNGLGDFLCSGETGNAPAGIAILGCASYEIARHFGKYFGMLITEAKFGDVLDFEIIEQTSCKIGER